jgi:hypothetical protein
MNLYEIKFTHFSPKSSKTGSVGYLLAENNEEVFNWFATNPTLNNIRVYSGYDEEELDEVHATHHFNYSAIGEETKRDRLIRLCGEMFDDEVELYDLYYGKTLYGWELKKEDVCKEQLLLDFSNYNIEVAIVKK